MTMLNIKINTKQFIETVNTTKHFIGDKEEERRVLRCIHFDFSVKGELSVVAANGYYLARQKIPVNTPFRGSFSVVESELKTLIPTLKATKEVTLTFDGNQLEVNSTPLDIFTDMKFPDYKRVLPVLPVQGVLTAKPIVEALKSVKEPGRKPHNPQLVAITFDGCSLGLWKGAWGHTYREGFLLADQIYSTPVTTVNKTLIVFNLNYLLTGFKPFKDEVVLRFSEAGTQSTSVANSLVLESGAVTVCVMPMIFSTYKKAYENFLRTVQ